MHSENQASRLRDGSHSNETVLSLTSTSVGFPAANGGVVSNAASSESSEGSGKYCSKYFTHSCFA